jgi:transcriptional regulator with XRE-family HTH domain
MAKGVRRRSVAVDLLNLALVKAIRRQMERRNLTVVVVAAKTQKSHGSLSMLLSLKNPRTMTTTTLFFIAHAMGVKASELLAIAERIAVAEYLELKAGRTALTNIQQGKEQVMHKSDDKDAPEETEETTDEETEEEEEAEEEDEEDEEDEDAEEDEEDTPADEA